MRKELILPIVFVLLLIVVAGLAFFVKPMKMEESIRELEEKAIPTATPSATLAPARNMPIFVPSNSSSQSQSPQQSQPAQSSSTTNNSTTNNTTNNLPQPTPQPTQPQQVIPTICRGGVLCL